MGYYKYLQENYQGIRSKIKQKENKELRDLILTRKKSWRESKPIERVEHPIRIDKARRYGYKAKQGFVATRIRVKKGSLNRSRPAKGRRPKRAGVKKITPGKSLQRIAEERVQKKFPNLEVLASYWLWQDGQYKWYEVILVDPSHPQIKTDKDINWISKKQHKKRVLRGLTPTGKKGRGLTKKGKGAEKVRPSIKAHDRKGK